MTRAPLRVAHVVGTAGRSGVESHLEALLPSFDPAVVQARLFVPGPGPLVERLAARGFRAEMGAPPRKLAWSEARGLAARLRGACDVLHAHGPRASFWAAYVARAARIPCYVCTVHELRWRSLPPGPRRALWLALESWAMRRADRLIVLSQDSEARLRERFPDLAGRLTRIPGSTPLMFDEPALRRPRTRPVGGTLRIIAIGRLERVKRHDRLLEAVAMARAGGAAVELHVAGEGPLHSALRERARALGIEAHVRWIGVTDDIPGLLADGDLYASASLTEAFPIALLEAMAMGLPVVTCDNGGGSELVEDGVCGLVVRPSTDPEAARGLADAFVALAADPARRTASGAAASRRARERYSPAAMARATATLYLARQRPEESLTAPARSFSAPR